MVVAPAQPVHQALRHWAQAQPLPQRWGIALSGGADSTALLHAAQALWPGRIHALHINHGLQAAATDFERHCQQLCSALQVPLSVLSVDAQAQAGQSPEDAARRARYRALATAAQAAGLREVWLAQHQDDQLETLLLALSRGAGVPGLAAMPPVFERHGQRFARPLLSVAGEAIRDWLRGEALAYCEDPTNADTSYTRNRIRHQVTPALRQAFPAIADMASRTAQHMAQAQQLLQELAALDLTATGSPPQIAHLQALSPERQANALRHWLKHSHAVVPSTAQLDALLQQVAACTTRGHDIHLKLGPGFVRREQAALRYDANL